MKLNIYEEEFQKIIKEIFYLFDKNNIGYLNSIQIEVKNHFYI